MGFKRLAVAVLLAVFGAGALPPAAEAAEKVTLTMIAESRDSHLRWQQEMIEAFQAQHPHVEVELVSTAGSGLVDKMRTMLAGGAPLDIGYMDPWLVVEWGKEGILENLQPYIERESLHFAAWPPAFFDLYRVDGGIYALPQDIQISGIFYNKNAYDAAGLAYPTPDWTYDNLFENSRRLTVAGPAGDAVQRYGFRLPGGRNWVPLVWGFGGELVDNWAAPTRFIGNTAEVAAALQYMNDLVASGLVQDRSAPPVIESFMQGLVAMVFTNSIVLGHFHEIEDFAWDVAPLPHGPGGSTPFINAIGWFMFSTSQHKQEAWDLLRFFTTEEALRRRVEIIGNVAPSIAVTQDSWLPHYAAPENRHLLLHNIDMARSPWPISNDLWRVIDEEGSAAIWGEKPVNSALDEMERRVNALLGVN